VADASGHGLGAALLVAETRAFVRALAMTCTDTGRVLTLVNQRLTANPDTEGFVTAFLLRLAPDCTSFTFSSAGHCPGIVFDKLGNLVRELSSTGFPLGLMPSFEFRTESGNLLHPGDMVLLYTDGAVESCSSKGELFCRYRLLEVVRAHLNESPDKIIDGIFRAIGDFCETEVLRDDVSLVIIKATRKPEASG
jgi:sigma-B regulation protein RsbU (phosphoserine phosphatase)